MKKYLDTMPESLESKITQIFGETVAKEGNKFSAALMAARENGKKFFSVNGKQFKTEDYKEGFGANTPSNPTAGVKTVRQAQAARRASGGTRTNPGQMRPKTEALDKVNPTAVKKKFDDRKDKDIDNDGDVDSSDKYLHKRRKAISKAVKSEITDKQKKLPKKLQAAIMKKEKEDGMKESIVDIQQQKNLSMREMLAKIWGVNEGKSPFEPQKTEQAKAPKTSKTESGQKATKVEINPEIAPVVQTQIVPNSDR